MIDAQAIAAAVTALQRGDLVAFPTETVYGLGADAENDRAVARVYEAKGRPLFNPLIAHVATAAAAAAQGVLNADAQRLAEAFWPGPLTLVVPRSAQCRVSLLASSGLDTIGLRVPRHPVALALLRAIGRPVVAPSANPAGRISPTTAAHVRRYLADKVDIILDGGPCAVGVESTVVSCIDNQVAVLRPGGIGRAEIETQLGRNLDAVQHMPEKPASPGMLASHYAPKAILRMGALTEKPGEVLIGFGSIQQKSAFNLSPSGNLVEAAANLFRLLHQADELNPPVIAVAPIPHHGLGEAINDRLTRAAAPRPAAGSAP